MMNHKENHKDRLDTISKLHIKAYIYFSKNMPNFATCQDFIQRSMQIVDTWDKPIDLDTQHLTCIITPQNWEHKTVVRSSLKTPLLKAMQECILIYDTLLPSLSNQYPQGIHTITDEIMLLFVLDVTTLLDVYTSLQSKRWPKKYWKVTYNNTNFTHQKKPFEEVTQQTTTNVATALREDSKHINLTSMYDLIAYINRSTFPVNITDQWVMIINRLKAMRISDLQAPCMYNFKHLNTYYTFDNLIKSSIVKRWNNIDDKDFIDSNVSMLIKNGEKTALYIAIIKNIKKLYLAYTGRHMRLQYDDGTNAKFDWETTYQSMHISKPSNTHITKAMLPSKKWYIAKKKILKNEHNDNTLISVSLWQSLWYKDNFAKTLQDFCEQKIVQSKTSWPISIATLAYYRTHLHPSKIQGFFKEYKLKFCILALDRILENYLPDKQHSYKEWSEVRIATK
jgi:hypothetical protein